MTSTTSLPKEIVDLINLEELDISMTAVKSLPAGMNMMKKLKKLDLMDTPISADENLRKKIISEFKSCEIIW